MEKLTLSFVGRYTTDKNNQPLVSKKTGKPYTSLRIKANEYGEKYLSGFDSAETKDWKIGDVVEVEVEQKGEYLNFSVPRKQQTSGMSQDQFILIMRELHAINANSLRIWGEIDPNKNLTSAGTQVPDFSQTPEPPEFTEEDLPNY